jgi:hypothetical protein
MGFEPETPVFAYSRTFQALYYAANVIVSIETQEEQILCI